MLITCSSCQKALNLADDKVPSRPFILTCPSCKHRQQVDPASPLGLTTAAPPAMSAAPLSTPSASLEQLTDGGDAGNEIGKIAEEVEDIDAGPDGFIPLPGLRPQDAQLLHGLSPAALIVNLAQAPIYPLTAGLKLLGLQEVRYFSDLESACQTITETEIAIALIWMEKAAPPPCKPLDPLHKLPMDVRRRTFVVLMADNVRSLDGQVAFYLQVNCLVNAQEIPRLPSLLRRALLHHLRLYRAWDEEIASV